MMTCRAPTIAWCAVACALWLGASVQAQELRDPTLAPAQATAASGAAAPSPLGLGGTSVIVRDGKAGLVQGTRVVFPGQKWGNSTLERITETEVWLRDGKTLRKLARFGGIERKLTPTPTTTPPTSTPAGTQGDAPPTRSSTP